MTAYLDEKRRRIDQFAEYLRLMRLRSHKVVKNGCFIIFEESPPDDVDSPKIKLSVAIKVGAGGSSLTGRTLGAEGLRQYGQAVERQTRYLQFAFMRDCFYLELPNNTVFPQEAEKIFRDRLGFYWAKRRTDLAWVRSNWEDMLKWNPLQKVYLYRDEMSAAEDMAYILFQVWHFPADSPLYVTAASFHTGHRFERGKRIE